MVMLSIPLIIEWRQYLSTVAGECVIMFLTAWSRAQTGRHRPATPGNMGWAWRMKSRWKKPMFWILKPARWTCCVWTSTSLLRAALEHWVLKMFGEHCEHCGKLSSKDVRWTLTCMLQCILKLMSNKDALRNDQCELLRAEPIIIVADLQM